MRLPDNLSSLEPLPFAAEEGAEFSPGSHFFLNPAEGADYLRRNFASQTPENIDEGMQRLAAALERLMAEKKG